MPEVWRFQSRGKTKITLDKSAFAGNYSTVTNLFSCVVSNGKFFIFFSDALFVSFASPLVIW